MKADILRRAEALSTDEEDEEYDEPKLKGKGKISFPPDMDVGPDEDDEIPVPLRVAGDGEDSGDENDDDDEEAEEEGPQPPETIVELAYLRDPKLFDRDAATRRSKARADLRAQTGKLRYHLLTLFTKKPSHQAGGMNKLRDGKLCWREM